MNKALRFIIIVLSVLFILVTGAYCGVRYLYPVEYEAQITKCSDEFGVSRELVLAVVKCESGFDADAVSSVGAVGLMQLTPDTFEWVQKRLDGSVSYDRQSLFDPDTNIRYGVYLLKLHLDEFEDEKVALAAYHAGRGKVNEWLADPDISPDGKTLSYIPYNDTSIHVEKVAKTIKIYEFLY